VSVTDARGVPVPAGRTLGAWLRAAAPSRARGRVTIAIVSDAVIRQLNHRFRRLDRVTDVLSFPSNDPHAPSLLGDIVIARGVCARQAKAAGHSTAVELRVLALHGLLHLLGYDHHTDQGTMRRVEERLRRKAGLPTGLIARAAGRPPSR
jgi:probable rRNA maturation factor